MDSKNYISSGIVEQYVLGLCTTLEKAEIEHLRKTDAVLNEAILNFEIQFENEMLRHESLPNSETDDKILSNLRTMCNAPKVSNDLVKARIFPYKQLKRMAIAASILFGFSAILNTLQYFKNEAQSQELLASNTKKSPTTLPLSDYQILKDPAITPIAMYGVGSHSICRCTMFWDKKTGKVYMMIHHLPKSSEARDYQLWATVGGKPISVGIIDDAIRDRFIDMNNMPAGSTSFFVTLEKAGGSEVPTDDIYLKGNIDI